MQIQLSGQKLDTELLVLPLFSGQKATKIKISAQAAADFKNTLGASHLIYSETTPKRILLLGLGEKSKFTPAQLRIAWHSAMQACRSLEITSATLMLPETSSSLLPQTLEMTGFALTFSSYQFEHYKKEAKKLKLNDIFIVAPRQARLTKALSNGIMIGQAANEARNVGNHPGNVATPVHLAKHAVDLARRYKFSCKVLGPKEIAKEGMSLIMGVAAGSEQPPQFIIMEYGPKSKPPLVLIGKGLTFDSGGVSIKPADRMEEMKYDMCGGATVLGIFQAAAALKLPVHLVGLIPSTENLLSGKAVKPGDILKAHDGTTVEVINTDAEGRLVLADAISFAKKYYKPKLMIDYATLTGAIVIAIGDQLTGFFANTKAYTPIFEKSAKASAEQFWDMPLSDKYKDELRSMFADIKNVGEKGSAGAITAALFLEHFVGKTPWIHMDIAGTAWTMRPRPYATPGATAWGVYLSINFLRNQK